MGETTGSPSHTAHAIHPPCTPSALSTVYSTCPAHGHSPLPIHTTQSCSACALHCTLHMLSHVMRRAPCTCTPCTHVHVRIVGYICQHRPHNPHIACMRIRAAHPAPHTLCSAITICSWCIACHIACAIPCLQRTAYLAMAAVQCTMGSRWGIPCAPIPCACTSAWGIPCAPIPCACTSAWGVPVHAHCAVQVFEQSLWAVLFVLTGGGVGLLLRAWPERPVCGGGSLEGEG